jgi:predicted PurR-regulated permease PerM
MTTESHNWFMLALAIAAAWLIYLLAPVITPFAVAAALAYFGDPLVDRLERFRIARWKFSRTLAVVLVFALMTTALVVVLLIVIPLLQEQVRRVVDSFPEFLDWVATTVLPWLQQTLGFSAETLDAASISKALRAYWKEVSSAAFDLLGTVSRSGQAVMGWLMNLVLIPVVTFYLLRDWDLLIKGIRKLLPPYLEPAISGLAAEIDEVLAAFIRGQLMVMFALGLIYFIGLSLVGLDLAFIIGMGAGLLSVVPYLGTIVGVVAAVVAVMFQFQDIVHLALVLLVFGVGQALEGMVLTPKLVGDKVGLHPVAVIFAVLAGGQLFGFLGILLALPVASALNVVVRHANESYRRSSLFRKPAEQATTDERGSGEIDQAGQIVDNDVEPGEMESGESEPAADP